MINWLRDIYNAVTTVAKGLMVTLRYWLSTYRQDRGTFTELFEYPEKPVPVMARYRGFHRFDLTTCIACDQCAKRGDRSHPSSAWFGYGQCHRFASESWTIATTWFA